MVFKAPSNPDHSMSYNAPGSHAKQAQSPSPFQGALFQPALVMAHILCGVVNDKEMGIS